MHLISKFNKGILFLLSIVYFFSDIRILPMKDRKDEANVTGLIKFIVESTKVVNFRRTIKVFKDKSIAGSVIKTLRYMLITLVKLDYNDTVQNKITLRPKRDS